MKIKILIFGETIIDDSNSSHNSIDDEETLYYKQNGISLEYLKQNSIINKNIQQNNNYRFMIGILFIIVILLFILVFVLSICWIFHTQNILKMLESQNQLINKQNQVLNQMLHLITNNHTTVIQTSFH